jgi:HAD superfamily hydrolase (TIGR01509 family)
MSASSRPPDLVIFDCDGVLVDSEPIAIKLDLVLLERVGLKLTEQELIDRFLGRSESVLHEEIAAHLGHPLDPEVKEEFHQLHTEMLERELKPVPGVVDALARLQRPTCVASSSTPESLYRKLTLTGLYEQFEGHIFSAVEVPNGKPAPDLFLYAAHQMGVEPNRCVVVEDSQYGVLAARAAGMHVYAYASGLVNPGTLRGPETTLFTNMSQLVELIWEQAAGLD